MTSNPIHSPKAAAALLTAAAHLSAIHVDGYDPSDTSSLRQSRGGVTTTHPCWADLDLRSGGTHERRPGGGALQQLASSSRSAAGSGGSGGFFRSLGVAAGGVGGDGPGPGSGSGYSARSALPEEVRQKMTWLPWVHDWRDQAVRLSEHPRAILRYAVVLKRLSFSTCSRYQVHERALIWPC